MNAGSRPDCRSLALRQTPPRGNFAVLAARPQRAEQAQKE